MPYRGSCKSCGNEFDHVYDEFIDGKLACASCTPKSAVIYTFTLAATFKATTAADAVDDESVMIPHSLVKDVLRQDPLQLYMNNDSAFEFL